MELSHGAPLFMEDISATMKVQTFREPYGYTSKQFRRLVRNLKMRGIMFTVHESFLPDSPLIWHRHSVDLVVGKQMLRFSIVEYL